MSAGSSATPSRPRFRQSLGRMSVSPSLQLSRAALNSHVYQVSRRKALLREKSTRQNALTYA